MADTIIGWTLTSLWYDHALKILDNIIKINWGWYTLDLDRPTDINAIGAPSENIAIDDTMTQEVA